MRVVPWLRCLLALVPAALASGAHPGPSVWGEIVLRDREMVFLVEGAADPLTTNLGLERLLIGPLSPSEEAQVRSEVLEFCSQKLRVELDDSRRAPELTDLIIQDGLPEDGSWRSARFVLTYRYESLPRKMSITWPGFSGEGVEFVPVVIRVGDAGRPRMFSMYAEEPQFIWHATDVRPRATRVVTQVEGRARRLAPTAPATLLLAGILLVLLWLVLLWRRRRGAGWPESVAMAVLGCGGALLLSISSGVPLPSLEERRRIFETLHGNIYQAFSADTEDEIYDLLQTSVDATRLDDLYGDIYESLILREQGGAVCGIDRLEPLGGSVDSHSANGGEQSASSEFPEFSVDWSWRVHGAVAHWGHIHRRTNQYRAEYRVRHDGESWKIAAVEVLSHERTEDD